MPQNISESTKQIFTKFSELETWVWMINLTFVLQSPKGHCHGYELIWRQKMNTDLIPPSYVVLLFHKILEYLPLNVCSSSRANGATSCKNLANFYW